ncbi:uncharacterized protein LOC108670588 isoform X2 [Hyalella azteca]|nr:uncharacterized protein LOC108670588 isoform X2 [Hyalella azteca]
MCAISAGISGCLTLSLPAMVAATWFPANERTTATAVAALFSQLGSAVIYLEPLLVRAPDRAGDDPNKCSSYSRNSVRSERSERDLLLPNAVSEVESRYWANSFNNSGKIESRHKRFSPQAIKSGASPNAANPVHVVSKGDLLSKSNPRTKTSELKKQKVVDGPLGPVRRRLSRSAQYNDEDLDKYNKPSSVTTPAVATSGIYGRPSTQLDDRQLSDDGSYSSNRFGFADSQSSDRNDIQGSDTPGTPSRGNNFNAFVSSSSGDNVYGPDGRFQDSRPSLDDPNEQMEPNGKNPSNSINRYQGNRYLDDHYQSHSNMASRGQYSPNSGDQYQGSDNYADPNQAKPRSQSDDRRNQDGPYNNGLYKDHPNRDKRFQYDPYGSNRMNPSNDQSWSDPNYRDQGNPSQEYGYQADSPASLDSQNSRTPGGVYKFNPYENNQENLSAASNPGFGQTYNANQQPKDGFNDQSSYPVEPRYQNIGMNLTSILPPNGYPESSFPAESNHSDDATEVFDNTGLRFRSGPYTAQDGEERETTYDSHVTPNDVYGDIMNLMYIYAGIAGLLFLLAVAYFPRQPPHPPSPSSAEERLDYFAGMKTIIKDPQLMLLVLTYAFSVGVPLVWVAVMNFSLCCIGIGQEEAMFVAMAAVLLSCATAFIAARITDLIFGYLKLTIIVLLALASVCFLWFLLISVGVIPSSLVQVYLSVAGGVALQYATVPLLTEFAVELAYPCPESVVGVMIIGSFNVVSAIFLLLFLIPSQCYVWVNGVLVACTSLTIIPLIFVKETYKRRALDQADGTDSLAGNLTAHEEIPNSAPPLEVKGQDEEPTPSPPPPEEGAQEEVSASLADVPNDRKHTEL